MSFHATLVKAGGVLAEHSPAILVGAGVVGFVHGDQDLVRVRGRLGQGVDDAAVVLAILMGGEDEEAVGEVVGRFAHGAPPCLGIV